MSNFAPFRIVLIQGPKDPAIDIEAFTALRTDAKGKDRDSAAVEYFQNAHNEKILAPFIRDGATPRWYMINPMRARALNDLVSNFYSATPSELWAITQRCLIDIQGDGDFKLQMSHFKVIDQAKGTKMLTDEAMDELAEAIGLLGVREIGNAVLHRTRIAPDRVAAF